MVLNSAEFNVQNKRKYEIRVLKLMKCKQLVLKLKTKSDINFND